MKYSTLITVVFSLYCVTVIQASFDGSIDSLTAQEVRSVVQWIKSKCRINDRKYERLLNAPSVSQFNRKMKCKLSCLYKIGDIISEDNKLIKDGLFLATKIGLIRGSDCRETKLYEKCSHITDSDQCEYAAKLHDCFQSGFKDSDELKLSEGFS